MEKTIKQERNSSFELLRIFAMLFIIASHVACHGVQHCLYSDSYIAYSAGSMINKLFVCFLNPGGTIGVAIFFMITGYFMINKSSFSIKKVVLEGSFYGLLLIVVLVICCLAGYQFEYLGLSSHIKILIRSVLDPSTSDTWWFMSAYVILLLLSPVINKFFNKYTKKGFLLLFSYIFVFVYGMSGLLGGAYYSIARGVTFYLIGGYIGKFVDVKKIGNKRYAWLLIFVIAWLLFALVNAYNLEFNSTSGTTAKAIDYLSVITTNSILIPMAAISFFLFFASLEFRNKLVNKIAATTFGIYLLHDSNLGRILFWNEIFKVDTDLYCSNLFPLYAILVIIAVFVMCSMIDMLRIIFIEPQLLKLCDKIKNKFNHNYKVEQVPDD